ncbi:molybdopterin dehydrogenase FAD-binding [Clostridium sp. DL-VIII]|uniref:FAD binding domain-containing protein n=1 Tax=Clostridium sp. DL-VIII TaxID=641107 RepID=UPI00023AF34D|nr:FAD binding domain-containing protein [Clostridium sp. DL-VIII]EHI97719.1 molybdopterin dehydrogenase FAD-binding [Clostridium sp. DL-VIII]
MKEFTYKSPRTVKEALEFLNEANENTYIVAGGTDIVIAINDDRVNAEQVININKLKELKYVQIDKNVVRVGALCTFSELEKNSLIKENIKVLYKAVSEVGSPQIRNLGTVGGNIVNASVAGDSITAFLALNAKVVLKNSYGQRVMSLREFYEGKGNCQIKKNELLTEIFFDKPTENMATSFCKLGKRNALAIVDIGGAMVIERGNNNICTKASVMGGALARYPLEFFNVEEFLVGKEISKETLYSCFDLLSEAVYESIKSRPLEVDYKKESVKGVFKTVFDEVLEYFKIA